MILEAERWSRRLVGLSLEAFMNRLDVQFSGVKGTELMWLVADRWLFS